jgi:hypothetical protein
MSAGKGDKPRPINKKKFDENYDLIFRKKIKNKIKRKTEADAEER